MTVITVQLDDRMAELLRQLAEAQKRSENDIVAEALTAYAKSARPLPLGMGKYHSGQANGSEEARDLIRQAAKDGIWP